MDQVDFREAKVEDIFNYLDSIAEEYRLSNSINIRKVRFVNMSKKVTGITDARITLKAVGVSLYDVLMMLTQIAQVKIRLEDGSVVYVSRGTETAQ